MAKKRQLVKCSRCKQVFYDNMVRSCPHPSVKQAFGENLCIYCCLKCKLHTRPSPHCGAVGCGYNKGE